MPFAVLSSLRALVTFPLRGARVAEFVFRRRDAGGDVYPEDASDGMVEGCDPDRVLFVGELGELTLGVRTHELSLPAFFARRRAAATGRGGGLVDRFGPVVQCPRSRGCSRRAGRSVGRV
jgi:hypothetical protein